MFIFKVFSDVTKPLDREIETSRLWFELKRFQFSTLSTHQRTFASLTIRNAAASIYIRLLAFRFYSSSQKRKSCEKSHEKIFLYLTCALFSVLLSRENVGELLYNFHCLLIHIFLATHHRQVIAKNPTIRRVKVYDVNERNGSSWVALWRVTGLKCFEWNHFLWVTTDELI